MLEWGELPEVRMESGNKGQELACLREGWNVCCGLAHLEPR